jgi:hypothetical protein
MNLQVRSFVIGTLILAGCSGPTDLEGGKRRITPKDEVAAKNQPKTASSNVVSAQETISKSLEPLKAEPQTAEPQTAGMLPTASPIVSSSPKPEFPSETGMAAGSAEGAPSAPPTVVFIPPPATATPAPAILPGTVVLVNQCQPYECGHSCLTCGPHCYGDIFGSEDPAACAARSLKFCPSTWKATWPGPNLAWFPGQNGNYECPPGTSKRNALITVPGACGTTRYECVKD